MDSGDDNGSVSVRQRAWYADGMSNMSELRFQAFRRGLIGEPEPAQFCRHQFFRE